VKAKFTFDALANNLRGGQLGEAGLRRYAPSSTKVGFSPSLTGSGSNPTGYEPGNTTPATTLTAVWVRQDDMVNMWFSITMASGYSPGSGFYGMTLPVDANTTYKHAGKWWAFDSNTSNACEGTIYTFSATSVVFYYPATAPIGTNTALGAGSPWTWAVNDQWHGHLTYVAA